MKHNWTQTKKEFWKWVDKISVVYVVIYNESRKASDIDLNAAGHSTYKNGLMTIMVDAWYINIEKTVIHEIMHWIFDDLWEKKATYAIYENWVNATEEQFRQRLTWKEREKLRRKLEPLIVVRR